jgi:predicted metalloprotease with PDZ domain
LYEKALEGQPYTKAMVLEILNSLCAYDFAGFYKKYVHGKQDFTAQLSHAAGVYQFQFSEKKYLSDFEHQYGLILSESNGIFTIQQTAPDSPAVKAGLLVGDQILAVNHLRLNRKWLINPLQEGQTEVSVFSKDVLKSMTLKRIDKSYYMAMQLS